MKRIKCLMTTGGNIDPIHNDDWCDTVILELGKEYTLEELVSLARCGDGDAIWVYEGEDWEDKENVMGKNMELLNGGVRYGQKFNPWDIDITTRQHLNDLIDTYYQKTY